MNLEHVFEKIKKEYHFSQIPGRLDEEILNWIEADWKETHYSEYDWYHEFCNGEAEDVIVQEMMAVAKNKYNSKKDFSYEDSLWLEDKIREHYELNF